MIIIHIGKKCVTLYKGFDKVVILIGYEIQVYTFMILGKIITEYYIQNMRERFKECEIYILFTKINDLFCVYVLFLIHIWFKSCIVNDIISLITLWYFYINIIKIYKQCGNIYLYVIYCTYKKHRFRNAYINMLNCNSLSLFD